MPVLLHAARFAGVAGLALIVFIAFWLAFWRAHKPPQSNRPKPTAPHHFFFDPQDCFRENVQGRKLPLSAETGTFEPMLKHYIGVTQLLVTVAAASIAFGGNQTQGVAIVAAKNILAWSIFYGVLFCALLLWRYDEYAQDMNSYTLSWYSTISALGFSTLICFMLGYLFWGWGLWK